MKPTFRLCVLSTSFLLALTALVRSAETAPESSASLHLPGMPLHDPFIFAYKPTQTYYLYTSNISQMTGVAGAGTMVYKSRDLRNWEAPKVVFLAPKSAFATQGAWAPEVHEYNGRFYLFTTLFDEKKTIAEPPRVWQRTYVRATIIAVSDSPDGPYKMLDELAPVTPPEFMTLDGTFYIDRTGQPWMVYSHEWLQKMDGTMEAIPLASDLTAAAGPPIHLFKASDAPWLNATITPSTKGLNFVTDGPELYRTNDGHLLMLWSSYENGMYVETVARSSSGELKGPWEQLAPLAENDSGHGMLFRTFAGQLMMILHHPFRHARGKLFEMADRGDHLEIIRQRVDLDGGK
jgi:beta-xylosidase